MKDQTWMGDRVYLAGGMTGIPQRNYPLFDEVHAYLEREYGVDVVSPVVMNRKLFPGIEDEPGHALGENDATEQDRRGMVMAWDIQAVIEADAIALLPDWELSAGATLERRVAEAVGRPVLLVEPGPGVGEWELALDHNQQRMSATELPPLRRAVERMEHFRPDLHSMSKEHTERGKKLQEVLLQGLAAAERKDRPSVFQRGGIVRPPGTLAMLPGGCVVEPAPRKTFSRKPVQFHCMPPAGLTQLGIVGGMGADKHGSNSYREGNPPQASYHLDAIFRHLIEYMEGIDADAESGASPLAHVAWRALAIIQGHEDLGASFDDRWRK